MFKKLICFFLGHKITCKAGEGIPATEEQLKAGIAGFFEYARLYCKRCEKEFKK